MQKGCGTNVYNGKSILIGMAGFGVEIIEVKRNYLKFSVPEFSDHVDVHGNEMAGKLLIKRMRDKNLFGPDMQFEGVIRKGETWNNSRRKEAEAKMMKTLKEIDYGF